MKIRITDARINAAAGIDCTLQLHGLAVATCHSEGVDGDIHITAALTRAEEAIRDAEAQCRSMGETLSGVIARKARRELSGTRVH